MTKKEKNSPLLNQPNLFEWVKEYTSKCKPNTSPAAGSLDIDSEFRATVSQDLKHARDCKGREISRFQVAASMSELTGREITASMLNNWSAESHEKHNLYAKDLPAFILATGGQRRAFEVLSKASGLVAMPGPEALRAEIQQFEEEIRRLTGEKTKRRIFLKEMEKK